MTGTPSKTSVLVIIGEYILALVISLFWSSIHFQKSDQRQIALYIFKGVIGHCDDLCHGAVQHARRLPSQWESSIPSDGEGGAQGTFHEFVFTDFFHQSIRQYDEKLWYNQTPTQTRVIDGVHIRFTPSSSPRIFEYEIQVLQVSYVRLV